VATMKIEIMKFRLDMDEIIPLKKIDLLPLNQTISEFVTGACIFISDKYNIKSQKRIYGKFRIYHSDGTKWQTIGSMDRLGNFGGRIIKEVIILNIRKLHTSVRVNPVQL
jgi:hypothetical protein